MLGPFLASASGMIVATPEKGSVNFFFVPKGGTVEITRFNGPKASLKYRLHPRLVAVDWPPTKPAAKEFLAKHVD